jgi:hypothetical protein
MRRWLRSKCDKWHPPTRPRLGRLEAQLASVIVAQLAFHYYIIAIYCDESFPGLRK